MKEAQEIEMGEKEAGKAAEVVQLMQAAVKDRRRRSGQEAKRSKGGKAALDAVLKGKGVDPNGALSKHQSIVDNLEIEQNAKGRWQAAGRYAREMAYVKARLEEDVTMPTQEDIDASLSTGFRAVQSCVHAKHLHQDALDSLAWKAYEAEHAGEAGRQKGKGGLLGKFKGAEDTQTYIRHKKGSNKSIEAMLQRNAEEKERLRLADLEEEKSARAEGRVFQHHNRSDMEVMMNSMQFELNLRPREVAAPAVADAAPAGGGTGAMLERGRTMVERGGAHVMNAPGAAVKAGLKAAAPGAAPSALGTATEAEAAAASEELLEVRLTKPDAGAKVGLTLAQRPANEFGRPAAVLVAGFAPGGLAAAAQPGFHIRDEVTHINGEPVLAHDAATALVRAACGEVVFALRRRQGPRSSCSI